MTDRTRNVLLTYVNYQKISVALNLTEIIDVIESLPEEHNLLPMLRDKADILLAVYKLRRREEAK